MKVTRIHLLRHGQVEGYQTKRYNGQAEAALTDLGRQQSAAFAGRFQHMTLQAIYSSDLRRCRIAADQIALLQMVDPQYCRELRELHAGDWEGVPWETLKKQDPELWQLRLNDIVNIAPPGGESVQQMAQRVRSLMKKILSDHAGGNIVVVGHGGINRVMLLDAIGAPLECLFHIEQDFGCHNIIEYSADGTPTVKKMNG